MIDKYHSIIISRVAGIGDVLMLTPLLQGIKRKYPDIKLSIVTKENAYPLTQRMPFIDNAYVFTKTSKNEFELIKSLWKQDVVFCADTSYRISLIYFLARIKNRIGFPHKRGIYLNKPIEYERWMDYSWEPYLHAMLFRNTTGIDVTTEDNWKSFYFPPANDVEKEHVIKTFTSLGGKVDSDYIAVSLESSTWQKDWPIEYWLQLFSKLQQKHIKFVILGGPSNQLANIKFPDNVIDMSGKTNLFEMGYMVQHAKLVVANSCLFLHVAYAFNIPSIGIYGRQPVWRDAPPNMFCSVVTDAPCAPCDLLIKPKGRCNNPFCMKRITVDKVYTAILKYFESIGIYL